MSTITGYKKDSLGTYIEKDPEARLIYSMDWSQWLPSGSDITSVNYTVSARSNDAHPPVIHDDGITQAGTVTYVELSGGTLGKIYTVTAEIDTDSGLTDRRNFRVKIEARSL